MILIAIRSLSSNFAARCAVRDTWFPRCHEIVQARFFVDHEIPSEVGLAADTIVVDFSNQIVDIAILRYALENIYFDWIFVCDDETYVIVDRIKRLVEACRVLGVNQRDSVIHRNLGHGGRLYPREVVEIAIESENQQVTSKFEIPGVGASRDEVSFEVPRLQNGIQGMRGLTPEGIRALHVILTQEPGLRLAVGSGLASELHLYDSGVYSHSPNGGFGQWSIDAENNIVLAGYSRGTYIKAAIPIDLVFEREFSTPRKVGILIIATGRYRRLIWQLIQSVRLNFLAGHVRTIFLFTDVAYPEAPDLRVIPIQHRKWPEITLFRYDLFRKHQHVLEEMDFLFYLDADVRVEGPVGEEILSDLTAVLHPGYLKVCRTALPYDRNSLSTAMVATEEGAQYYYGAVQGGSSMNYLDVCRSMAERIENDWSRGIVALWHDESHWNRVLIDKPPTKVLSPSYGFPETSSLPYPKKIIALDKDHSLMRRDGDNGDLIDAVVVRLKGGLGNQMFQFANGLALARKCGSSLDLCCDDLQRGFRLHVFGLPLALGSDFEKGSCYVNNAGYQFGMENEVFDGVIQNNSGRVIIEGYFQNERFFRGLEDEIRARFFMAPHLPVDCETKTPVCMQIRRGDFIGNSKFDLCRPEYFYDAMAIVRALVANPLFIVVSDDLAWSRETFGDLDDIFVPESQTEYEGMRTMVACKAFIISNSTYGWWGAWLSSANIVVAPDPFVSDQQWDCVPTRWIRLAAWGIRCSGTTSQALSRNSYLP